MLAFVLLFQFDIVHADVCISVSVVHCTRCCLHLCSSSTLCTLFSASLFLFDISHVVVYIFCFAIDRFQNPLIS